MQWITFEWMFYGWNKKNFMHLKTKKFRKPVRYVTDFGPLDILGHHGDFKVEWGVGASQLLKSSIDNFSSRIVINQYMLDKFK